MCVNETRYKEESSVRVSVYGVVYDNGGGNIWSNVCPYFIVYTELFRAAQTLLLADLNTRTHLFGILLSKQIGNFSEFRSMSPHLTLCVHTHIFINKQRRCTEETANMAM